MHNKSISLNETCEMNFNYKLNFGFCFSNKHLNLFSGRTISSTNNAPAFKVRHSGELEFRAVCLETSQCLGTRLNINDQENLNIILNRKLLIALTRCELEVALGIEKKLKLYKLTQ